METYRVENQATPLAQNKKLWIGLGAGLLVLFCCCCLALILLLVLDPFNWGLLGRLQGNQDKAAEGIPADANMYVGLNLLNATPDKFFKLLKPWQSLLEDGGMDVQDTDSLQNQIDNDYLSDLGMTMAGDVVPWLGQYAGVGITDLRLDSYGNPEALQAVFSVETRNKNAADAFLEKLAAALEREQNANISNETYRDVQMYLWDTGDADYNPAFARSGSLLLFATDVVQLRKAIDAQKKGSLWDEGGYRNAAKSLPGKRFLTFYMTANTYRDLLSSTDYLDSMGLPMDLSEQINWTDMAYSVSLLDEGLGVDAVVAYDPDKLTPEQRKAMTSYSKKQPDSYFPENTLVLISGQGLNVAWASLRDAMSGASSGADYDEAMNSFAEQFGIHPDTDLFPYLDRELAIGLLPADSGLIADQMNMSLGLVMSLGTSQPDELNNSLLSLTDAMRANTSYTIDDTDVAGRSFYLVKDDYTGEIMLYGMDKNNVFLSDGRASLEAILDGGKKLSSNAKYKQTWKAFDGGMIPVLYTNVTGILDVVASSLEGYSLDDFREIEDYLRPITTVASAVSPLKNNRVRISLIIFIETP